MRKENGLNHLVAVETRGGLRDILPTPFIQKFIILALIAERAGKNEVIWPVRTPVRERNHVVNVIATAYIALAILTLAILKGVLPLDIGRSIMTGGILLSSTAVDQGQSSGIPPTFCVPPAKGPFPNDIGIGNSILTPPLITAILVEMPVTLLVLLAAFKISRTPLTSIDGTSRFYMWLLSTTLLYLTSTIIAVIRFIAALESAILRAEAIGRLHLQASRTSQMARETLLRAFPAKTVKAILILFAERKVLSGCRKRLSTSLAKLHAFRGRRTRNAILTTAFTLSAKTVFSGREILGSCGEGLHAPIARLLWYSITHGTAPIRIITPRDVCSIAGAKHCLPQYLTTKHDITAIEYTKCNRRITLTDSAAPTGSGQSGNSRTVESLVKYDALHAEYDMILTLEGA